MVYVSSQCITLMLTDTTFDFKNALLNVEINIKMMYKYCSLLVYVNSYC